MPIPSSAGKENKSSRPYRFSQLLFSYLQHFFVASNSKGHGVHSPFVYDFICNVMRSPRRPEKNLILEKLRTKLRRDNRTLTVEERGAGSALIRGNTRSVAAIAGSSLKSEKLATLLQQIVLHYGYENILELGTSLGITTAYLASAKDNVNVYTIEGASEVAVIARENFEKLGIQNISLTVGDFDEQLPGVLNEMGKVDLAFLDGNHRYEPTLRYFEMIIPFSHQNTMFIFDDIHWSPEMEMAWDAICLDPRVTATLDLFHLGVVLVSPDFKEKRHFKLRY